VSEWPKAEVTWGEPERQRLRATRKHAGHNMTMCAGILRADFGVPSASQPNISRWEKGTTQRPQCVSELLAYCDAYGKTTAPAGDSAVSEQSEFERLASQAAGEPLLGTAQLELVRGMNHRLACGPPLSPEDRATYLDQLRILRVPDGSGDE
jgi:hypothetical protein